MYFLHPSPYEMGGSPDVEVEDAVLEANGIAPYNGSELGLVRLEGTDPIDADRLRNVAGFSLTCSSYESCVRLPEDLSDELSYMVTGGRATEFEEAFGVNLGISSRTL